MTTPPTPPFDLVVAANRLPVDRADGPDGTAGWRRSPGGLVTAMESVMAGRDGAWVGWAGEAGDAPAPFVDSGMYLAPVPLSRQEVADHYEGFSNDTLWPIYHDVIVPASFHRQWWQAYRAVNQRFADAVAEITAPGGTVWIHDYQLQLVPGMVRAVRPDVRIGWFNHIPFPPVELFAQLPWRGAIIDGLLGADFLGFQRRADAENFLRACRRLAGLTTRGETVVTGPPGAPRVVRAAAVPISIDVTGLEALARTPAVRARAAEIRASLGNPTTVLLGVDRLDYTKGIRHRLKAYEELLSEGHLRPPEAAFVQVATPSRERVEAYQQLRTEIEQTVGRINGEYAAIGASAVEYLHHSYPREEMAALFQAADIMLVTPLRDGMNLVAKEYVTCRVDEGGALVLSEFTGAWHELRQAYVCNPHDIEGLKNVIREAAEAPASERRRRMRSLRRRVADNDVHNWARTFLDALAHAPGRPPRARDARPDGPSANPSAPLRQEHPGSREPVSPGAGEDRGAADDGAATHRAAPYAGVAERIGGPVVPTSTSQASSGTDASPGTDPLDGTTAALDAALERVVRADRLLVASDFDGVLAPLVDDPMSSRPLAGSIEAIRALAGLPHTAAALVSGRALGTLGPLSGTAAYPQVILIGSHGAESTEPGWEMPLSPEQAGPLTVMDGHLRALQARFPEVRLEEKPTSVVLHTRGIDPLVAATVGVEACEVAATLPGLRVLTGKDVLEFTPLTVDKGTAVANLARRLDATAVVYFGDDTTDEHVFELLGPADLGIKVGPGPTAAMHRVAGPEEAVALLSALAVGRKGHTAG